MGLVSGLKGQGTFLSSFPPPEDIIRKWASVSQLWTHSCGPVTVSPSIWISRLRRVNKKSFASKSLLSDTLLQHPNRLRQSWHFKGYVLVLVKVTTAVAKPHNQTTSLSQFINQGIQDRNLKRTGQWRQELLRSPRRATTDHHFLHDCSTSFLFEPRTTGQEWYTTPNAPSPPPSITN